MGTLHDILMGTWTPGRQVKSRGEGPFFCEQCCRRYLAAGDCKACPEEPLLDLRNDDVVEMLRDFDRQRLMKRTGQTTVVGMVVTAPFVVATLVLDLGGRATFIGGALMVVLISSVLMLVWPPQRRTPRDLP